MKAIRISFRAASENSGRVHGLKNVGEEIHCYFLGIGIAEVPNIDSGTAEIHVVVSAKNWSQHGKVRTLYFPS